MTQFEALLISWALEIPVLLVFDRWINHHWRWQACCAGLLATGFTHPLVWEAMLTFYPLMPGYGLWLGIEIIVMLVEASIYRWLLFREWRWALMMSVLANLVSASIGLLL